MLALTRSAIIRTTSLIPNAMKLGQPHQSNISRIVSSSLSHSTLNIPSQRTQHTRFFVTQIDDKSECLVTLFQQKRGDKDRTHSIVLTFPKHSAKKASEFAIFYFGIRGEWNKKFIESLFYDLDLNWFELTKKDQPNTLLGIRFSGNRHNVIEKSPKENYVPLEKEHSIRVTKKNLISGKRWYQIERDKVLQSGQDHFLVAFYNNTAFKSAKAGSTNIVCSTELEKLDGPKF